MIQYIENFVSPFLLNDIKKEILESKTFLWQLRSETASQYNAPDFACLYDEKTKDSPQLIHIVEPESKDMSVISPLIYKIVETVGYEVQFQRVKINLLWPDITVKDKELYHVPHADHGRSDAKTLIYYINDADGDTVIFKNRWTGVDPGQLIVEKRIKPKAGSAVLFDSNMYHASSSPTTNIRSVINFIFWPKTIPDVTNDDLPPLPTNIPIAKGFDKL
jgi:hypothetical protein